MVILKKYLSFDKKYVIILFLVFLISLNFSLASQFRDTLPSTIMSSDDLVHIEIADSFRDEKSFNLS